eukprot:scaffold3841_cov412-Prasinococcus_capsulatus_cf.AAC.15
MREAPLPAAVAKQIVLDERMLDSNPRLNLASFVTTWMEPEANEIMTQAMNVNFIDAEEYPSTTEMQNRCVAMLWHLYHGGEGRPQQGTEDKQEAKRLKTVEKPTGTATVGSSEAIMLAGLALKRRWEARRRAEGKPVGTDACKPNLVLGHNCQVCWEKFVRYFDVEPRFVALEEDCYTLTADKAIALVDEYTIGVCCILGSTYNGEYEDVQALNEALLKYADETKTSPIPIHVDAASGRKQGRRVDPSPVAWLGLASGRGFVAPFIQPHIIWDFRLPLVASINVSGHKYGLVYPGVGWVLWRNQSHLPEELVFHTNYLGSDQPTVTLNFSKGASQIVGQYYQLCRLGLSGYRKIMSNLMAVARHLADGIKATGHFRLLCNLDNGLPLVAFGLLGNRGYDEFAIADKLRQRGWVLPAYTFAPNAGHVKLLRAVVRVDLSYDMVDELVGDIQRAVDYLDAHHAPIPAESKEAYMAKHQPHRSKTGRKGHKHRSGVC